MQLWLETKLLQIYRNSSTGKQTWHWWSCRTLQTYTEMEEMCIKAKHAVQGDMVGVDLMESEEKGLVVHEVNNTTEYKNTVRVCKLIFQH